MYRCLITILLALHAQMTFAIDESRVIHQCDVLVKRIREMHVKPRAIDDAFGKNVHEQFMRSTDPYHFLFTKEDIAVLEQLALSIDDDIQNRQVTYLREAAKRLEERLNSFEKWSSAALKQPMVFSGKSSPESVYATAPSAKEQINRWKEYVLLDVIDEMIDALPREQTAFPNDSLSAFERRARTRLERYYSELYTTLSDPRTIETAYLEAVSLTFDPHTMYFSPSMKEEFEEELTPERELFGFSYGLSDKGVIVITDVFPGSSAWVSDQVHEGDKIIRIKLAGSPTFDVTGNGQSLAKLRSYLDEHAAREITLFLESENGETREVKLIKRKVYSDGDAIKNAVLQSRHKIGYISLPDFYVSWTDTTQLGCANDVAKCLLKLSKEQIGGVIIDLRGNGGGSLREAVDMVGLFIDYGPVLAIAEQGERVEILRDFNRGSVYTGPLIVMVDAESASASEIVAGALQDYNRALIIGERSFGKATSQSVYPLDPQLNKYSMLLTAGREDYGYANITNGLLYRVTGDWNQVKGVEPDIRLPFRFEAGNQREGDYTNVLLPDSLKKKVTFTPGKALPLEQLKTASNDRMASDSLSAGYRLLIAEMEKRYLADSLRYFDPVAQLAVVKQWRDYSKQLHELMENSQPGFEATPNQFDAEIYQADNWRLDYYKRFLANLKEDMELIETVRIMNDWIDLKQ